MINKNRNIHFDIFLYLDNHQMIHIPHNNLVNLDILESYPHTIYTKGSTIMKDFIKRAHLSFKPVGTYDFKDNSFNKLQILYANSDYVNYYFNEDKHVHIEVSENTDDLITLSITEFQTNHVADLNFDFLLYNQLKRSNLLKISDILKLSPRELEQALRPRYNIRQQMSPADIIDHVKPDLYLIEKWLIKNNIPYSQSNLFNYDQHSHYILETTSVRDLDFGTRALNALNRGGYNTVYQLLQAKPQQIRKVRNVGNNTFNEISGVTYRWCQSNGIKDLSQFPLYYRES